jgi:hypothetical protein
MPLLGKDKFLGGVIGSDGHIYGIPGHAKGVLRVHAETGEVREDIYGIPGHAQGILRVHAETGEVSREDSY